jgi:hypothetical protein
MTTNSSVGGPPRASGPGLLSRFVGVIFSPKQTFEAVAANPKWLGIMVVVVLLTAGAQAWFMSTEVGRIAAADQAERGMGLARSFVSEEQFARMQEETRRGYIEGSFARVALLPAASIAVLTPIFAAAIAGILMLVFGVFSSGKASFKQLYATVAHAGVITAVGALFLTPLNYVRESMSSATNLSVFVPGLPEGAFITRLLGTIDLLLLWWLFVLAIGVGVVYKKKTQSVAITLLAIYGVIALAIAGIGAMLGRGGA